jgi:hypothetical protein
MFMGRDYHKREQASLLGAANITSILWRRELTGERTVARWRFCLPLVSSIPPLVARKTRAGGISRRISLSVSESAVRRAWPTVLTAPLDLFGGRRIHRVIGYGVRALEKRREIFRSENEQDHYNEGRNEQQILAPGQDNSSLLLTRAAASSFCNCG